MLKITAKFAIAEEKIEQNTVINVEGASESTIITVLGSELASVKKITVHSG